MMSLGVLLYSPCGCSPYLYFGQREVYVYVLIGEIECVDAIYQQRFLTPINEPD